jgi:hypothetical protein
LSFAAFAGVKESNARVTSINNLAIIKSSLVFIQRTILEIQAWSIDPEIANPKITGGTNQQIIEWRGGRALTHANKRRTMPLRRPQWNDPMSSSPQSHPAEDDGLEAAVDQAIAACDGDMRSTVRALIVANDYLETEVTELMKAVSQAYVRGRFNSYSG